MSNAEKIPSSLASYQTHTQQNSQENKPIFATKKSSSSSSTKIRKSSAKKVQRKSSSKRKVRSFEDWIEMYYSPCLRADEKLLVQLKGFDRLPWKEIKVKFKDVVGIESNEATLQMRVSRASERIKALRVNKESGPQESISTITPSSLPPPVPNENWVETLHHQNSTTTLQSQTNMTCLMPLSLPWSICGDNSNYYSGDASHISALDDMFYTNGPQITHSQVNEEGLNGNNLSNVMAPISYPSQNPYGSVDSSDGMMETPYTSHNLADENYIYQFEQQLPPIYDNYSGWNTMHTNASSL